MIEPKKNRIKPELKVADIVNPLKTMDSNAIVERLEENIKLREMPVEKQAKKGLLK